jgi:hypothetical protein
MGDHAGADAAGSHKSDSVEDAGDAGNYGEAPVGEFAKGKMDGSEDDSR